MGRASNVVTEPQLASLALEMGRRAVVAGVVQFALFLVFYFAMPFSKGRPAGAHVAFGVLATTVGLRGVVSWLQQKTFPDREWVARCKLLFRAVMMLGAMTWGLLTVPTILRYGISSPSSVLLIFVMGIAMLSLQNFGLDLGLVRAFVVAILGPGIVTLLVHPWEPAAFVTGCGYVVYGGFLLFLSARAHEVLWEALSSRTIIQAQRDQLTAVLDALPGFVVWTNESGAILGVNERLSMAYETSAKALVGQPLEQLWRAEDLFTTIRTFRESQRTEELVEANLAPPTGGRSLLLALKKYGGGGRHLLIIGLDIGVQKRAEAERDQARASASQAARLAELGTMAAGIGHEINNPLQALSYGLGLLRRHLESTTLSREQLSAEGLRIVKRATVTIQRIAAIVQGLRSFAQDDSHAELTTVDIGEVVRELQELGAATMPSAGVDLQVELPAAALVVRGHRAQIGQVVLNLVNNARDAVQGSEGDASGQASAAAPAKWIRIAASDLGDSIELSVEDSGPPIPAAVREQLMVPFFTTKGVGRGTGLGLSVSKAIVDHHHGRLFLDIAAPHTRFVVVLPKDPEKSSREQAFNQAQ